MRPVVGHTVADRLGTPGPTMPGTTIIPPTCEGLLAGLTISPIGLAPPDLPGLLTHPHLCFFAPQQERCVSIALTPGLRTPHIPPIQAPVEVFLAPKPVKAGTFFRTSLVFLPLRSGPLIPLDLPSCLCSPLLPGLLSAPTLSPEPLYVIEAICAILIPLSSHGRQHVLNVPPDLLFRFSLDELEEAVRS